MEPPPLAAGFVALAAGDAMRRHWRVLNPGSAAAPPESFLWWRWRDRLASMADLAAHLSGDVGVGLRHVGVLVGANAHRRLWPQILAWMRAR